MEDKWKTNESGYIYITSGLCSQADTKASMNY